MTSVQRRIMIVQKFWIGGALLGQLPVLSKDGKICKLSFPVCSHGVSDCLLQVARLNFHDHSACSPQHPCFF